MSANTLLTSVVTGGSNSHATVAEEANAYATDFVAAGVVGTIGVNVGSGGTGSFCVNADASPDMGVTIKAGQAYVTATPSGQNSQILRVRAAADYTAYTINANASGSTKYDWIYLTISATNANTPSSDASNVASFVTSRSSSNTTDNGSPPTYGILLAIVTVANAASSITNSVIVDKRTQASLSTLGSPSATGWTSLSQVPNTITANGNRSYTCVFNSVDITGTVSAGMRLRTTRITTAPTQCTSLNGTTQFYSKTSPAGMTFTNFPVAMAWVKISSYQSGAQQSIISRYNGTSGYDFQIDPSGRVALYGFNAGAGNFNGVVSYQSIPLNRWVHVVAQLDMSTATLDSTHSYVMIDGVNVPAQKSTGGTAPTALIQAGNLEIGSRNGGLVPLNGKIAQVAIFSAAVTQATIQSYYSQGLAGTETSEISAYSFNNSINDLNANANNLTANGSAVATNSDSPFGGQAGGSISSTLDYGIITSASFSTNTTLVVQVPEGCTIPTSGGVSAVSYSTVSAPYGFPRQNGKWRIGNLYMTSVSTTSNATYGAFNSGGFAIAAPIGEWTVGYNFEGASNGATTQIFWNLSSTALTGLTNTNGFLTSQLASRQLPSAASATTLPVRASRPQSLATQTTYTIYTLGATTSGGLDGTATLNEIYAEFSQI